MGVAAAAAAGLTLASGFGLATLLMPVLALFFPVSEAIALTAVVHLLNNLFKLLLLGRHTRYPIVLKFGIPALASAVLGAWALVELSKIPSLAVYHFLGMERVISPVKCVIALLMAGFGLLEILPRWQAFSFQPKYLPLGGVLSGFFGGLSGHQGAFRSAFLAKCGLTTEGFLGTGVAIAILIDLARIPVYLGHLGTFDGGQSGPILVLATVSAFAGSWIGFRLARRLTIQTVQRGVAFFLFLIAAALASGLI